MGIVVILVSTNSVAFLFLLSVQPIPDMESLLHSVIAYPPIPALVNAVGPEAYDTPLGGAQSRSRSVHACLKP